MKLHEKKVGMVALLIGMLLSGCTNSSTTSTPVIPSSPAEQQTVHKLQIVTTIYPLADFTQQVAGEYADVKNLVPPGVEPHDWEPTPKDMELIQKADVFIYNGGGFEGWVPDALKSTSQSKRVVVETIQGIDLLEAPEGEEKAHESEGEEHTHLDPHVWLDPVLAQKQVTSIQEALMKADPTHQDAYQRNAAAYLEKLKQLDQKFSTTLANIQRKEFVTQHAAFGYLAKRYHLKQIPIAGLSPDVEPSPAKLVEIVKFAKEHQVKTIFFETLTAPKVAETVAKEIGATTAVLNPIEGLTEMEQAQHKDYLQLMDANLQSLANALR